MTKNCDVIRKINLLCNGLRTNKHVEEIYDCKNPYDLTRTGNVGLQLLIGESKLVGNVPVFNEFVEESPYVIEKEENKYYAKNIIDGDRFVLTPIQTPVWYTRIVDEAYYAGQFLLREGVSTLICSITDSCGYVAKKMQCKFCAIGNNSSHNVRENSNKRKKHVMEAILVALSDQQEVETSINLTGGNTFTSDKGALRYIDYVTEIRRFYSIPVCIELSPPDSNQVLDELKKSGVDAVMMNIEIWDDNIRGMIMPGESQISKRRYLEAWKYAVSLFGRGNVSSVIIVGLESVSSQKKAIDAMTSIGVMPSIMPFRPNDGALLESFPKATPSAVIELTKYAVDKAIEYGINPKGAPGCIGCGACAAELDIIEKEGDVCCDE